MRFVVPLENFSLIWRLHLYQWRAANFNQCSALMTMDKWGFFSLPHLVWHGTSAYNGNLQGPVTLTLIADRFAVELLLPVFTSKVCRSRLGIEHLTSHWWGKRSNQYLLFHINWLSITRSSRDYTKVREIESSSFQESGNFRLCSIDFKF